MPMINDQDICSAPTHGSGGQPQTGPIEETDALGNTWCGECVHRGGFINWGHAHGYPALEIHPYAMAEGAFYWQMTATQGDESRMWTFLGLIEMKEEEVA